MNASLDPIQRAMRNDGALSARAVLDHFNERGRALLGEEQADAAARIAAMLAHEADLSASWGGLPGTDHPRHWQADAGEEAALSDSRSEHRRLDVHLPVWWALPLTVRERGAQRVCLPLALNHAALAALVRRHLPGAWWNATVRVLLDVETRVYWGARGAVHPCAAARHACAQRGDAGRPALALVTLRQGNIVEGALDDRQADPDVSLTLHPGVGWLVALPVLRFERELTRSERLQMRIAQWWREIRSSAGSPAERDRDPTFLARLASDEAWWAGQLGSPPLARDALARAARRGAVLRPASRPALQPAAARAQAQVIVIHGGLSSARSGFEAALNTKARAVAKALDVNIDLQARSPQAADAAKLVTALAFDAAAAVDAQGERMAGTTVSCDPASRAIDLALAARAPATPAGLAAWPGLPTLDQRATWRFEHDTFLGVARNVAGLVASVREQCIAGAGARSARHIVLIAHSRGGNVARFGLPALRKAFGSQGWTFAAVTLGSPHLGTHVFERVGQRWHGLAAAVGGLRDLGAPWMDRETLAELVNLERGLAYDVPRGFHDVEPAGVERMMRGRPATELPDGMWLVGSHWGPGAGLEERAWDWLFEDVLGAEDEGDGLVQRHSALGGRAADPDSASTSGAQGPAQFDASPVFHTHYLVHEDTRARISRMLAQALAHRT